MKGNVSFIKKSDYKWDVVVGECKLGKIGKLNTLCFNPNRFVQFIYPSELRQIADFCDQQGMDTDTNVNIIAAAPDLLEALEGAVRCWETDLSMGHEIDRYYYQKARDAIAKAKGKERTMKTGGEAKNMFSDFLRLKIDRLELPLRELSKRCGIDAANLSRLERGVVYPPRKLEVLERLSEALGLDVSEKDKMIDLAKTVNGKLIEELDYVKSNDAIPLLLRAIENKKLQSDQVEALAKLINEENSFNGSDCDVLSIIEIANKALKEAKGEVE
jgi:transcriptional regulator with XRE-family HTH domain